MAIEISEGRSGPDGPAQAAPPRRRRLRTVIACSGVLALSACASLTPPPRFSAVSPADPNGPESAVAPARPMLTEDGELAGEPVSAPPAAEGMPDMPGMERLAGPDPRADHIQTGTNAASAEAAVYSCRMHPQVSANDPGRCPICGMALVKKAAKTPEPGQ